MNQTPLISICMLCYNHEKFVAESIESILLQSYGNWELIIVDNASTDRSQQIIDQYANRDDRIIFLPQRTNTFVSLGLNIAMRQAKGEYITLLSADDNFKPHKLKEQLHFMEANELDISYTWIDAINSQSQSSAPDVEKWFNRSDAFTQEDILRYYFNMTNITCAPTVMLKSSLLHKTSMHDHRLLQTQDMEYWIRLFKRTEKVAILHEKLTNYRVLENGENLSSNKSPTKVNRTNFEMTQLWEELFTLDTAILSNVFHTRITDDNKYFVLYEHLRTAKIDAWQYAMLVQIYHKLGADCDIDSPLFKLFFEEYGKFSLVSENFLFETQESFTWYKQQLDAREKDIRHLENRIKHMDQELRNKDESLYLYNDLISRVDRTILFLEKFNTCRNSLRQCAKKTIKKILGKKK